MSTEYPFQSSQSLVTQHMFTAHLFWARHPARLPGNTLREGAQERGKAPPQPPGVVRDAREGCGEHEREWRMVILWRDSKNQRKRCCSSDSVDRKLRWEPGPTGSSPETRPLSSPAKCCLGTCVATSALSSKYNCHTYHVVLTAANHMKNVSHNK